MTKNLNVPVTRGPLDHSVREQIVEAAFEHFGHYGYEKTTVAELAKSIGFSKAYIYKFFDSKQAIGEVICANRLELIMTAVHRRSPMRPPPARKYVVSSGRSPRQEANCFSTIVSFTTSPPWPRGKNGLQQKGIQNTS
jgi:AcrR family transcriptional regulator